MTSRTGQREQLDADDRARRPFDLVIRIKGSRAEFPWGRWADAGRAHQVGRDTLTTSFTRKSDYPFGRWCTAYRVIDSRTKKSVADPALLDDIAEFRKTA